MIDSLPQPADQLTVQQLRSFCAVFERQSYAAAARELRLAVPTIWEQVRAVERRYETALFVRQGRRIVSSPAAQTLYHALEPMLTGLDSTFALVAESDTPQSITVACGMRMLWEDFGKPLKSFRQRFPDVTLRLLHADLRAAQRMVIKGTVDLALTLEPQPGRLNRHVASEPAYPIDYLAVLPKRHPLAKKSRLRLGDLAGEPLVLGHSGTSARQVFDQAVHREQLSDHMRPVAETDNSAFTIFCVQTGLGVGIIAGRPNESLTRGLVTRSLRADLGQGRVVFLWKRGRHLSPAVRQLMELLRRSR